MKKLFEKYKNLINIRDLERRLDVSHGVLYHWLEGRNELNDAVETKLRKYLSEFSTELAKEVEYAA